MAFHFMARSAEWTAKGPLGKFLLDKVLLIRNVVFYKNGRRTDDPWTADEVRVVFGSTKKGGGELRCTFLAGNELCAVKAMARVTAVHKGRDDRLPFFSWQIGSKRAGDGVRYHDVLKALKASAEALHQSPQDYGTHSLRRGGATQYLACGAPLEFVRMQGRWKSDCVRQYIDLVDTELKPYVRRAAVGFRLSHVIDAVENPQLLRPGLAQSTWMATAHRLRQAAPGSSQQDAAHVGVAGRD